MAVMEKAEAISIIHRCAVLYDKNLSGKNVLFVTVNENKATCFETLFQPSNYLHLTGVKTGLNSEVFLNAAISKRLSPTDIVFDSEGYTKLKLEARRSLC